MVHIRPAVSMTEIARSAQQWTGVTITNEGRMFVSYPRWSHKVPISVAELLPSGEVLPYPDASWNDWRPGKPPQNAFVCAQSVYVDDDNTLWILDPANPINPASREHLGLVKGGPKLVQVDPKTDKVVRIYHFEPPTVLSQSYLNDVRVDTRKRKAFITDSGAGALVVVDLEKENGEPRRLLEHHPSVKAEPVVLTIDSNEWKPNGQVPRVHSDGIALSPDREYIYYQALTGRSLYRIRTDALLDTSLLSDALGAEVERIGETGAADGIEFGSDGCLYLTALEKNAITRLTPDNRVEIVAIDDRLQWPDSIAKGADGSLYVTTAQIHLGSPPPGPFRVFHLKLFQ